MQPHRISDIIGRKSRRYLRKTQSLHQHNITHQQKNNHITPSSDLELRTKQSQQSSKESKPNYSPQMKPQLWFSLMPRRISDLRPTTTDGQQHTTNHSHTRTHPSQETKHKHPTKSTILHSHIHKRHITKNNIEHKESQKR